MIGAQSQENHACALVLTRSGNRFRKGGAFIMKGDGGRMGERRDVMLCGTGQNELMNGAIGHNAAF